jgi:hypothetical protein
MNYSFILTSGTTFKLPNDANLIQVECFGPSCSLASNLGGSYSKSYKVKVTPGSTLYYNIGTGNSGNTWVNTVSFSQPSSGSGSNTNNSCLATGGSYYTSQTYQVNDCIGDIVNPGGLNTTQLFGGVVAYGAGGQAGPNGKGGDAIYTNNTGAGGGANGGNNATINGVNAQQGAGRLGSLTSGGSGGKTYPGPTSGTKDLLYTDSIRNTNGPQGGGAAYSGCYQCATYYSLDNPNGFIVITIINPKLNTTLTSTYIERYTVGSGMIRVPIGTTNILVEGIGAGSSGGSGTATFNTNYTAGGGGGGYANTNISTSVKDFTKGGFIFYNVPAGGAYTSVNINTWINIAANTIPTTGSGNIVAASAYSNTGGGSSFAISRGLSPNIGGNTAIGGDGGQGITVTSSSVHKGGGGGGAAYIYAGGNGGQPLNTTTTAYPGGGGGSAGTLSGVGQTGGTGTSTVGGRGANTAVATGTGGAGGTTALFAGSGTNGGGGGGSALNNTYQPAGAGSKYNVASWYDSSTPTVYGPGGGGGGAGSSSSVTGTGGSGAIGYGGGGGGGDNGGAGGPGLLVITYTIDTTLALASSNQENCYGYIIG